MAKVNYIFIFFILVSFGMNAQKLDSLAENRAIKLFQAELNDEYKSRENSPLDEGDRKKFKGHEFFPVDLKYMVNAKLTKTPNEPFFELKTSSGKTKLYRKYGEVSFKIDGSDFKLNVYQGKALMEKEEYKDHLFLPFTDLTTGNETYGGGRYIDLKIPEGDELVINFNKAYNPYCAYSDKYDCPIVPAENFLDLEIRAGIMLREKH